MDTPSGEYMFNEIWEWSYLQQGYLKSPTVFNFFTPFYAEGEFVTPENMVSPEFQILNSVTAINHLNRMEYTIKDIGNYYHGRPFKNYTKIDTVHNDDGSCDFTIAKNENDRTYLNFQPYIDTYINSNEDLSTLIDELDIMLCRGQLHPEVKNHIQYSIEKKITNVPNYDEEDVVQDVIYYIVSSPSYAILK